MRLSDNSRLFVPRMQCSALAVHCWSGVHPHRSRLCGAAQMRCTASGTRASEQSSPGERSDTRDQCREGPAYRLRSCGLQFITRCELICPLAQAQFHASACGKLARRANHSKPVHPLARKYSAFVLTQITGITPPVSRQMRGVGHRHERAVRCGGHECHD